MKFKKYYFNIYIFLKKAATVTMLNSIFVYETQFPEIAICVRSLTETQLKYLNRVSCGLRSVRITR
jgi:hypothetical protein